MLLFAIVVAPGLLFDLGSSSRLVRAKESAFHEIARITLASLFFSGFALGLAVLAHRWWPSNFLNPDGALRGGWDYVREHQVPAVSSLVLVFVSSLTAAGVVNLIWTVRVHGWGKPWMRTKSAWSVVFKAPGLEPESSVLATAVLSDGHVIRGRVTDFSADLEREDRELVLVRPISTKKPGGDAKDRPNLDAVVLSATEIVSLQIEYMRPEQGSEKGWRAWLAVVVQAYWQPAVTVMIVVFASTFHMWLGLVVGVIATVVLGRRRPGLGNPEPPVPEPNPPTLVGGPSNVEEQPTGP